MFRVMVDGKKVFRSCSFLQALSYAERHYKEWEIRNKENEILVANEGISLYINPKVKELLLPDLLALLKHFSRLAEEYLFLLEE